MGHTMQIDIGSFTWFIMIQRQDLVKRCWRKAFLLHYLAGECQYFQILIFEKDIQSRLTFKDPDQDHSRVYIKYMFDLIMFWFRATVHVIKTTLYRDLLPSTVGHFSAQHNWFCCLLIFQLQRAEVVSHVGNNLDRTLGKFPPLYGPLLTQIW